VDRTLFFVQELGAGKGSDKAAVECIGFGILIFRAFRYTCSQITLPQKSICADSCHSNLFPQLRNRCNLFINNILKLFEMLLSAFDF
jgi:hypothetical protein